MSRVLHENPTTVGGWVLLVLACAVAYLISRTVLAYLRRRFGRRT